MTRDFVVAERTVEQAGQSLGQAGFRVERPPEDWLFKAYSGDAMVDVLHRLNGVPVDGDFLRRAESREILGLRIPLMPGPRRPAASENRCRGSCGEPHVSTRDQRRGVSPAVINELGLSVPLPTVAAMTQHIDSSESTGAQRDTDAQEDIQVARGDDAEGAVGSASPAASVDTAEDHMPDTLGGTRPDPAASASKDPSDWVTGDEPITGPQASYLDTLAREANEEIPANITKAEASEQIDRLQAKTGRGR